MLLKGGCSTIGADTLFYATTSPLSSSQPSLCIGDSLDAAKHRFSNCFSGIFSQHSGGSFLTLRRHPGGGGGGGESVIFIQLHIWSRQLLGFSMHIVRNLSPPSNLPQTMWCPAVKVGQPFLLFPNRPREEKRRKLRRQKKKNSLAPRPPLRHPAVPALRQCKLLYLHRPDRSGSLRKRADW